MSLPRIDTEFASLIPPLTPDEQAGLEASLLAEGCRDALIIWQETGLLLDGHNRLRVCEAHGIPFKTTTISLPDREAALDWIDANQLGRRNLCPDAAALLRGRRYNRTKKAHGGDRRSEQAAAESSGQSDHLKSADALAAEHGVSPRTVRRDGEFAAAVDSLKATEPEIEQQVLAGEVSRADVVRRNKRDETRARLESTQIKEIKAAAGVYDVIVIDPPWPMKKIERDERPNQVAELDYPTMSEDELRGLPIPAAADCHVWLWTTHKFLHVALHLLEHWGLKYVCEFVWCKPGGFQPVGLPQYNCEFALYARKGSPAFLDTKAFNVSFTAQRGAHSEKPEEFYATIRRVTAGRRLDMFNRRTIDGFDGWGLEAK